MKICRKEKKSCAFENFNIKCFHNFCYKLSLTQPIPMLASLCMQIGFEGCERKEENQVRMYDVNKSQHSELFGGKNLNVFVYEHTNLRRLQL